MYRFTAKIFCYLVAAIFISSLNDVKPTLAQTSSLRIFSSTNIMGYLEPCG
ncbi:MAG: hypothetical protein ONB16_01080 [candidate division KSB1 bacterium]|nr:hypothetical protein [candidate division KSB1 bacterium]MDZ7341066.1 hypothetical protein [candidate division KSB1 bacterium]